MKILIIDNFDSFTYNLYQTVGDILTISGESFSIIVIRNDAASVAEIARANYDRIIISPGPGNPRDKKYFGVCRDVLLNVSKTVPTLGVCLGMQGFAHVYGGVIKQAKIPLHGKTSNVSHDATGVFKNIPQNIAVMRYHSLIVEAKGIPSCLKVTAKSEDTNEVMGLRHKKYPIEGIQFHPESFMTERGETIIRNFLFSPYYPLNI